ncbi:uncharacterized protein PV09_02571 [Verruconis gallopava]|uniref:Uncharacterized protein n=1 Tax=Verruconis gallopava TaxID=253628 RepID=A0A0D1XVV4_9PEZI|nr:uncharacterized protein PV09_02571 [Verruconis gallopava]KIW06901.1 hypothetical protein PV09_02571 [Verruconis gallopava]
MNKNKATVPDAWDDDWERQADKMAAEPPLPEPEVKLSKAERLAKHEEANRQLWEDADEVKEKPFFLLARNEPAYKTEFKPTLKVLSRKPPPNVAKRGDATSAMANLNLENEEDSEEENRKKAALEFEERKARAIREREEKQRRYQEVREKLFGTDDSKTRPSSSSGEVSSSRNSSRGKGRGQGRQQDKDSRANGSNDQSPARPSSQRRQLYDPNSSEKPSSQYVQRRTNGESGRSTPNEERPSRAPRGPDGSGRGGFGFAPRGGKISNGS